MMILVGGYTAWHDLVIVLTHVQGQNICKVSHKACDPRNQKVLPPRIVCCCHLSSVV